MSFNFTDPLQFPTFMDWPKPPFPADAAGSVAAAPVVNPWPSESSAPAAAASPSPPSLPPPRFDLYRAVNYTVQQGATALMPCTIRNLGNESVR